MSELEKELNDNRQKLVNESKNDLDLIKEDEKVETRDITNVPFANTEDLFPEYNKLQELVFPFMRNGRELKIMVIMRKGISGNALDEVRQDSTSYTKQGEIEIDQKKYKKELWKRLVKETKPPISYKKIGLMDSQLQSKIFEAINEVFKSAGRHVDFANIMTKN